MSGTVSDNTSQSSGSVTEAAGGVSIVSSDPTLTEGLLWYNSTSNVLKVARLALTAGTWSTGGTLNTARRQFAGAGTLTAGLCAAGSTGSKSVVTEEYDGSSWTTVNAFPTATQYLDGCGTQTAALTAGGDQ
jgi:hypothetical protein